MLPTLARGAALLGDAGSRGLYGGPLTSGASSTQAPRPSGDKNGGGSSGGGATTSSSSTATSAVAAASSAAVTSVVSALPPSSSSVYLRTHSRFNFARPSFELSRRGSVDASAVATTSSKAVGSRRVCCIFVFVFNQSSHVLFFAFFLLRASWRRATRGGPSARTRLPRDGQFYALRRRLDVA